ncbi:hypothetical protein V6N12_024987 [Hibiscus sabdariffa]|uniref:Uncharacterized protein n=1 Tax=Hibiscus sabdariffa TaxID=183260 RepID=A0ABR2AVW7_9ROSI
MGQCFVSGSAQPQDQDQVVEEGVDQLSRSALPVSAVAQSEKQAQVVEVDVGHRLESWVDTMQTLLHNSDREAEKETSPESIYNNMEMIHPLGDRSQGKKFPRLGSFNRRSGLDHLLVNEDWIMKFKDLSKFVLRSYTDSAFYKRIRLGPRPFKLINAWMEKDDCKRILEEVWSKSRIAFHGIALKLIKTKLALKQRNLNSYGTWKVEVLSMGVVG